MYFLPIFEESENKHYIVAFHGTRSTVPFKNFDPKLIGTGLVSSGGMKYGGFFFTTEIENAEYFTEYFTVKVKILNVLNNPTNNSHPPTVLKKAIEDNNIYLIKNTYDGAMYSNIIVVPSALIKNVKILEWICIADKETMFSTWDDYFNFGGEENEEITKHDIEYFYSTIGEDLNFALQNAIFNEYYQSKL